MDFNRLFTRFANRTSKVAGRPIAFIVCITVVAAWAVSGPVFGFSDTWQLVINTSTTIVTFLMVFLIQNTQNRDNAALQAKLDELIRVGDSDNGFIGIEHLTDEELEAILEKCEREAKILHTKLRKKRSHPHSAAAAKDDGPVRKPVARKSSAKRKPA